jgi:copper resistance protein B
MPAGQAMTMQEAPSQGMSLMNHETIQMQTETPPAEARDPDAYAEGFTRTSGKYVLDPRYRLKMGDEEIFARVRFDKLEYVWARGNEWGTYEAQAWVGTTYDRLVVKAEGDIDSGKLQEAQTDVLWGHAISSFWDAQLGARFDYGRGTPSRQWLAVGLQGLSPYWFELDVTAYMGPEGRTALRLKADYDILFTQKLYLQPSLEVNFYGKNDPERETGSGLSDGTLGARLKYEVTRQFVPYIGVEWAGKFGKTADYAAESGAARNETRFVAGVSFWF